MLLQLAELFDCPATSAQPQSVWPMARAQGGSPCDKGLRAAPQLLRDLHLLLVNRVPHALHLPHSDLIRALILVQP